MTTNTEDDTDANQSATAAILHRMLMKRVGPTKQLTAEELSQVVPSDQRGDTKDILASEVANPESPIQTYADRQVYTLTSLEAAANRYESLTGETINYRDTEHSLSEPEEPETITLELTWDDVNDVDRALEQSDAVVSHTTEYNDHPPAVTITALPSDEAEITQTLRDATNGNVP